MTSPFDLSGKRAFVTGANTGIGQGIAVALAEAGAQVACVGRSSMAATRAMIAGSGGVSSEHRVDLADMDAAVAAFEAAAKDKGPFDILVNNAGIIRRADAVDFSESDWDDVIDVNLKTAFFLSKAFGSAAIADDRHGAIVNIASVLTFQGGIRVASYTASKHGMAGITRLLACEWAAKDVNVNAIAPGYIVTNNTAALRADEDRSAAILGRIPAGRWGAPSDIGGAAVFLASDAARYVHGAILPVDGGWLAR
ncbi:2-dehydro-3-deoxy-D-gluconate 5-dehydrogenase KduD [Jiella sonneratiae]|uniref:2-dehydro-3-deoxy-D-gluconate 5-dehydrogenase KduD n=1 Tax=Jiella sonneratiae TaxID=2816856 RepID=A0ABS3IX75_9HYPH|nr:2-dehydro-3-deoxy-D-gluconate 5-dehydrogenase KduD [Jiella sonneratiae]